MCSDNVRSRLWVRLATLATGAFVALTVGCGQHYVARGADLYGDGRYVEAEEVFERTEARLSESGAGERARFGLYRGATFLKLGDAAHAARWLGYARAVLSQEPDALGSRELALLEASLELLSEATTAPPEPTSDSELATAPADARRIAPVE